jgi:cellulose synthase/poly-beta-1,6-N-acetylglucosamine synthase-like glycosyltransferase
MLILSKIILLVLSFYAGLLLYLLIKLSLQKSQKPPLPRGDEGLPGVSIVIPFRNEAGNLGLLLSSLEAQSYDGPVEILLVNDGSSDGFQEVIASKQWAKPVTVIDSVFSPERQLTSKQQALDTGIKQAAYDRVAFTDADMVLEPDWLASLVGAELATGAALVFGHTVIRKGASPSMLDWFQSYQLEVLLATAYTFSSGNISGSCMGNNMLISRPAYLKIGGHDAVGYSIVEDRDLLAAFRKNRLRTAAVEPFLPTAGTCPAATAQEYLQQILRWVYGGFRGNSVLSLFGLLLIAQNFLFLLALMDLLPGNAALLALVNLLLTWLFVSLVFWRMKAVESPLLFLPYYMLFFFESFMLLFSLLVRRPVVWKNRQV